MTAASRSFAKWPHASGRNIHINPKATAVAPVKFCRTLFSKSFEPSKGKMRNLEKSGPWCWMEKAALRKIRETFDGTHNVSSALGVYHALAEVASDKGEEKFQTTYAWLAGLSGFSQRTVGERARELEDIGLLKVTVPTLRGPATYSLVQISNGCRTIGNGCVTIGNGEAPPLPTSEEKKKEEIEAMVAHQENGDSGSAFSDARKGLL